MSGPAYEWLKTGPDEFRAVRFLGEEETGRSFPVTREIARRFRPAVVYRYGADRSGVERFTEKERLMGWVVGVDSQGYRQVRDVHGVLWYFTPRECGDAPDGATGRVVPSGSSWRFVAEGERSS